MRRRATFVYDPHYDFNPTDIQLKARQLLHPGIRGAREERLTFGLKELPSDIVRVLQRSNELHIRWTSAKFSNATTPFVSACVPGLHVFYTPSEQQPDYDPKLICSTLQQVFSSGLKCVSTEKSFTQPTLVSARFASSAALQYYSVLPRATHLVAYIQRNICSQSDLSCFHQASLLNAADHIDIDYTSLSHALLITAYWSKPLDNYYDPIGELIFEHQWPLDISARPTDRVEVGMLAREKAIDPHDFKMAGFLTVLGEDDKPKATLFDFPSRHHTLPPSQSAAQSYAVAFSVPTGLHPTLNINFPSASALTWPESRPGDSHCALHAYFTLPSTIFADQYAFPTSQPDPLFEAAHHIHSLRSISGELDLEAPDYVIDKWGSAMLLELSTPEPSMSDSWQVSVPLHLRYLSPSNRSHSPIDIPWPVVFWACTAEEGTKFPVNPFDRTNLGYDGLFGTRTMFYHLAPDSTKSVDGRLVERINVPILHANKVGGEQVVELGTVVVIVLGFAWVLLKLGPSLAVAIGLRRSEVPAQQTKKQQ